MTKEDDELATLARGDRSGVMRELLAFLVENKKWWLLPIVIAVVLLGMLVFLSGTGAAPFIYTLF